MESTERSKDAGANGRWRTRLVMGMAIVIIIPSAIGFASKFIQFIRTYRTDSEGAFAIVPICNYLFVTAGFVCLLVWATAHGMFRDIEKPKYTLLEREDAIDKAGEAPAGMKTDA